MKRVILSVAVIIGLGLGLAGVSSAYAQSSQPDLSDEHRARISGNCSSALSSLSRLHATDALLRVNRGQLYESMSTKLMARFNSRITLNRLDGTSLVATTSNYERALATFRSDYQAYEQQMSVTLRSNCQEQPQAFYYAVADTREKRQKVHQDVQRLHSLIDEYATHIDSFQQEYQAAAKGARDV